MQETYNLYVQTQADYNYMTEVYAKTDNENRKLYDTIAELEEKLPSDVVVDALTVNLTNISISMSVSTKEEAAATIVNLRTFDNFSDVQVTSITEDKDDETGATAVTFTAVCVYGTNPALLAVDDSVEETVEE